MTESASLFSHYISTRGTFRYLSPLVIASAAVAWVAVGFDIAEVQLFAREELGLATADDEAAHSLVREIVFIVRVALLAATAVTFITWLYRCRANLRAFGTRHLRYSRNWAVFGFLIPLLNLVRPYQVTREVWQASNPRNTDPFEWKSLKPPLLFPAWWGTFVGFAAFKTIGVWMGMSSVWDPVRLQIAHGVEVLADVMAALSVTCVYFIIENITAAQETKWGRLAPPPGSP
jgi:hypothetical protein